MIQTKQPGVHHQGCNPPISLSRGRWNAITLIGHAVFILGIFTHVVSAYARGSDEGGDPMGDSAATTSSIGTAAIIQTGIGPADPSLDQQWHLKSRSEEPAGANVRAVWPTTEGTGIVVGIVDDGLQHTHPDLQPNYLSSPSWDFNDNDADPSPDIATNPHGSAVAGVAGARGGNGIGVSGVAPLTSIAGLRLTAEPISDDQIAAALGHRRDSIHILNNSWGPPDCVPSGDDDCTNTLAGPEPLTQLAIETAATQGRHGRGRIFVFAAGNGLQQQDNCNFDGYANGRFVIAVGALADNAQQASYSEPCSAMFVTAPSSGGSRAIHTTDLVGSSGYGPTDYTSSFGGTSSAAPLVSGIIALMLAENPALTWRDVKHILARSSVKVNPADPGWTPGPIAHNEKYGFGLVDAQTAVNLASSWTNVASESAIPAFSRAIHQPIPDDDVNGLLDSITISDAVLGFTVEHVEVEFDATHPYRGDLEVTLTSPAGVVSRLATIRPLDPGDNFTAWSFGSVRHWGESAAGTWSLRVSDRAISDSGMWNSWTLRIYGTASQLTLASNNLPTGERGIAYLYELQAGGGVAPYTWSRIRGKLPKGLTMNTAGTLTGVPTKAKTVTLTVIVTDTAGATAIKDLSLQIVKDVKLKTKRLSRGTVGILYSTTLQTAGGMPPIAFSLVGGALPPGLNLDSGTGQIVGTPTVAGTFEFVVQVTSSGGSSDQKKMRIKIR